MLCPECKVGLRCLCRPRCSKSSASQPGKVHPALPSSEAGGGAVQALPQSCNNDRLLRPHGAIRVAGGRTTRYARTLLKEPEAGCGAQGGRAGRPACGPCRKRGSCWSPSGCDFVARTPARAQTVRPIDCGNLETNVVSLPAKAESKCPLALLGGRHVDYRLSRALRHDRPRGPVAQHSCCTVERSCSVRPHRVWRSTSRLTICARRTRIRRAASTLTC